MTGSLQVLVVDDCPRNCDAMMTELRRCGLHLTCHRVETEVQYLDELERHPDLILANHELLSFGARRALEILRQRRLDIPLIVIAEATREETADAYMQVGAADYLRKDGPTRLGVAVSRALEEKRLRHDKQLAEDKWRESEKRLRLALHAARMGTWDWDLTADNHRYSDEIGVLFGFSTGQIPQSRMSLLESVHAHDRDRVEAWFRRTVEEGSYFETEFRVVWPDESVHWIRAQGQVFHDALGKPLRMLGVAMDVTARKEAEDKLRLSQTRLQMQIDRMPIGCLISDENFRYVHWNPAAEKIFGYDKEEVRGKHCLDLIVPATSQQLVRGVFARLERGDMSAHGICENSTKDGRTLTCEWHNTPLLSADGKFEGLLSMAQDITDRVRAEQEAAERQNQLAHVMRVNTMGQMLSELAHEINQPLYAIANYASACEQMLIPEPPGDMTRYLRQISEQAHRAGEILRRLGQFMRKAPPRREIVSVDELIRDIVGLMEIDASTKKVRLRLALAAGSSVLVDRVQIEQVVVNLVRNAIEALEHLEPNRREISISSICTPHETQVAVHDLGPGVDPQDLGRLFGSFFTTKPTGMGMGLSISKSIIESHGGRLWADPNDGLGITFRFALPRTKENSHAAATDCVHRR